MQHLSSFFAVLHALPRRTWQPVLYHHVYLKATQSSELQRALAVKWFEYLFPLLLQSRRPAPTASAAEREKGVSANAAAVAAAVQHQLMDPASERALLSVVTALITQCFTAVLSDPLTTSPAPSAAASVPGSPQGSASGSAATTSQGAGALSLSSLLIDVLQRVSGFCGWDAAACRVVRLLFAAMAKSVESLFASNSVIRNSAEHPAYVLAFVMGWEVLQ